MRTEQLQVDDIVATFRTVRDLIRKPRIQVSERVIPPRLIRRLVEPLFALSDLLNIGTRLFRTHNNLRTGRPRQYFFSFSPRSIYLFIAVNARLIAHCLA